MSVTSPSQVPDRRVAVPVLLVLAVYTFALMGRFTLDRLGYEQLGALDLRLVLGPVLLVAVLAWRFRPDAPRRRSPWPPAMLVALALFGYLALTAFWAPFGARVGDRLVDILALAFLVVSMGVLVAADPERVRFIVLLALLGSAAVYAVPGLLLGETNVQGRTAAFGGGPNVYIRVVVLGIIAATALAVIRRRKLYLLPIPLLAVAAVSTGSRGGLLALIATGLLFVLLYRRRISARALGVAVLIAAAVLAVSVTLVDATTLAVLQERFITDLFVQDQLSGRPQLFAETFQLFLAHPWTGGGLDAFYPAFGFSEDLSYPHNLVLEVAATGGLPALALLVAFVGSTSVMWRERLSPEQLALFLSAFFVAVASMFSGDLYDSRFLWIFAVLAVPRPRPALAGVPAPRGQPERYRGKKSLPSVELESRTL